MISASADRLIAALAIKHLASQLPRFHPTAIQKFLNCSIWLGLKFVIQNDKIRHSIQPKGTEPLAPFAPCRQNPYRAKEGYGQRPGTTLTM